MKLIYNETIKSYNLKNVLLLLYLNDLVSLNELAFIFKTQS